MSDRSTRRSPALGVALAAGVATALVLAPQLFLDSGDELPTLLGVGWLVLLAAAAPTAAAVTARRLPADTDAGPVLLTGLPQVVLVVVLARLDVWLDVRSGYLLADSGEEAMAYGLGSVAGAVAGSVLALLVGAAAALGVRRG